MADPAGTSPAQRKPGVAPLAVVALVAGVTAAAAVRLAGFVQAYAVNLPFEDQWDLLRPLFDGAGPLASFQLQHGPHRQGLGGVADWYLYRATQWDVRAEAWAAWVVLVGATLVAWRLAVRLRGRVSATDAVWPLLVLSPVHWETMVLTPNLAHGILPLFLVLLLALAWTVERPVARGAAVAVVGGLCLFTGFAFFAAVVSAGAGLVLALRVPGRGRAGAGVAVLGAAVAIAGFAVGYRWEPAVPGWHFPVAAWWDYPRFVALMFASLVGWRAVTVGAAAVGALLVVAVVAAGAVAWRAMWSGRDDPRSRAVLVLTGSSLAYAAFTAVGRLPVSLEAAFMWRYLPLLVPAVVGAIVQAEALAAPVARRAAVVLGLGVAALVWGNFTPERYAATIARAKRQWIRCYLETHSLAAANARSDFFVLRSDPESPRVAAHLRWLEERRLSFFAGPPPAD